MGMYIIPFEGVATGATPGTEKTLALLHVPNTAGARGRIRELVIGPHDAAGQDLSFMFTLRRIASVTAGGAGTGTTVAAASLGKRDPGSPDPPFSGGYNYSAEPTTYETAAQFVAGMNARGGIIKEWGPEDAPRAEADMIIGLLADPATTTAMVVSGYLAVESY